MICQSCGGVVGRDCYNPEECMWISQRMEAENVSQQHGYAIASLSEHDWTQIEQAANGCISGTSDEWPDLRAAIEKVMGREFGLRQSAAWMRGFCEAVMVLR